MFKIMIIYAHHSGSVTSQSFSFESRIDAEKAALCAQRMSGAYALKLYE